MSSDSDFLAEVRAWPDGLRHPVTERLLAMLDDATARATCAERIANDLATDLHASAGYRDGVADERARVEALVAIRLREPPGRLDDLLRKVRCLGKDMQPPAPAALLARLLACEGENAVMRKALASIWRVGDTNAAGLAHEALGEVDRANAD